MYYLGFLAYFGLFFAAFVGISPRPKYLLRKILVFIYWFLFFVVIAYRPYGAGSDTESYLNNYYLIQNGIDLPKTEIGFKYLLFALDFVNAGDREFWVVLTFLFMASFIFAGRNFSFTQKILVYLGLASSTAFFDLGTNGIRQGLAAGIGFIALFGISGLKRGLLIFLALLTHSSAAIFLVFFASWKINFLIKSSVLKTISTVLGILLIFFVMGINLISVKNFSFLPLDVIFSEKFISYADGDASGRYESLTFVGRLVQIIPLAVFAMFAYKLPPSAEFRRLYFAVLVFAFLYLALASTGYSYRWAYYSHLAIIYMVPWYMHSDIFKAVTVQKLTIALCGVYVIWGSYSVWLNGVLLWN